VALCGEAQFDGEQRDTLLNPTVIVEVLSPSTEAYDRGDKFGHYRKLASLAEYVLISQEKSHIEHYLRQPDNQWLLSEASDLQAVMQLPSIGCVLLLAEVYDKVEIRASL
jgi:Uma2 family endonuclease